jgi:hypothetical protein
VPVPPARSGFIDQVHARAEVGSTQHITWMVERHADLIEEIHRRAGVVVYEHDVLHRVGEASDGRLRFVLGRWTGIFKGQQYRAEAAVARANQVLGWYWHGVERTHRALRPGGSTADVRTWSPLRVDLNPEWSRPYNFLLLADHQDAPLGQPGNTLARALAILRLRPIIEGV